MGKPCPYSAQHKAQQWFQASTLRKLWCASRSRCVHKHHNYLLEATRIQRVCVVLMIPDCFHQHAAVGLIELRVCPFHQCCGLEVVLCTATSLDGARMAHGRRQWVGKQTSWRQALGLHPCMAAGTMWMVACMHACTRMHAHAGTINAACTNPS